MMACVVYARWGCCKVSVGVPVEMQYQGFAMVSCVVCASWGGCIVSDGVLVVV